MARPLREGVEALELTAKVTLAVLALASGGSASPRDGDWLAALAHRARGW
jgi:hypothetical protein